MKPKTASAVSHADVLDSADLELWQAFRASRSDYHVNGSRAGALDSLSKRFGRPVDELNAELVRIKSTLIDSGVIARTVFLLRRGWTGWHVSPTLSGSRAYRDAFAADENVAVFESARYAMNALVVWSLLDELDRDSCVAVADALDVAAADTGMPAEASGHSIVEVGDVGVGTFWYANQPLRVGVRHKSFRTHLMSANHARWVAAQLRNPDATAGVIAEI